MYTLKHDSGNTLMTPETQPETIIDAWQSDTAPASASNLTTLSLCCCVPAAWVETITAQCAKFEAQNV